MHRTSPRRSSPALVAEADPARRPGLDPATEMGPLIDERQRVIGRQPRRRGGRATAPRCCRRRRARRARLLLPADRPRRPARRRAGHARGDVRAGGRRPQRGATSRRALEEANRRRVRARRRGADAARRRTPSAPGASSRRHGEGQRRLRRRRPGAPQPRRQRPGFGYGPELLDEVTRTKVVHLEAAPPACGARPRVEAGVRTLLAADLRDGRPSTRDDVGGEVVLPAQQRGADAVGVDRGALGLEPPDLSTSKPPETTIRTRSWPAASSARGRARVSSTLTRGARPASPSPGAAPGRRAPRRCPGARPTVAARARRRPRWRSAPSRFEVDEHRDVHLLRVAAGERPRAGHRVAAVGGDERVRHRADPAAAPPRGLRVGPHADRAGDVGGPAVAGLHEPMVMAGREEQDLLAARGVDDGARRCA